MTESTTQDPGGVTAVVVARNRAHVIGRCLRALALGDVGEVIVVDGRSTDGTPDEAGALGATVVSDEGAGLAAARNLGAQIASTKWIIYVDSDVVVEPETVRTLLDEAESGSDDAVQARLGPVDSDLSYWQQGELWRRTIRERPGLARAIGCQATLVRRQLVIDVRFDPLFTGAGEDGDFFVRVTEAGGRVAFSARAVAHHEDRKSLAAFLRQRVWHGRGLARTALRQRRRYGTAAGKDGSNLGLGALGAPRFTPFSLVSVWGLGPGLAIELASLARDPDLRGRLRGTEQ